MSQFFFSYIDRPGLFLFGILISIPFFWMLASLFFDGWDGFLEDLRYLYQPAWLSMLRGEFYEDQWAGLKMIFFLLCCLIITATIYKIEKMIF